MSAGPVLTRILVVVLGIIITHIGNRSTIEVPDITAAYVPRAIVLDLEASKPHWRLERSSRSRIPSRVLSGGFLFLKSASGSIVILGIIIAHIRNIGIRYVSGIFGGYGPRAMVAARDASH